MTKSRSPSARTSSQAPARRGPGRPPRPATLPGEARELLLRSAIKLFARHGYDAVSTADIAKAANYAQSMVHYHFGTKEQIWRDAVAALMRRRGPIFAPMRLMQARLDPLAKLELLIRTLAAANAAEPDYARIIMHESISDSDRLDWLVREYVGPGFEVFDQALRDARDKGLIRDLPIHDLTNIVTSTVSLTFSLGPIIRKRYGIDPQDTENIDSLCAAIVTVLFEGLLPRE